VHDVEALGDLADDRRNRCSRAERRIIGGGGGLAQATDRDHDCLGARKGIACGGAR
jgi:hypothetical protein